MAAPPPPPNWAALPAASGHVHDSTNQIAQASANIPRDLISITTEPEQLEHQPTNAMLLHQSQQQFQQIQQQLTAMNHNITARLDNATLQDETDALSPLVHPQTHAQVADFPATSAILSGLSWSRKRALGISLGMDVPAENVDVNQKAAFLAPLRTTIGLQPWRPA